MADYWGHWLDMGHRASNPPAVFQVNWFRRDAEGKFMWPGFGQNMRVLRWIYGQVTGNEKGGSRETPVGIVPDPSAIGATDLGLLLFGAGKLAGVGKSLGTGIKEFRKAIHEEETPATPVVAQSPTCPHCHQPVKAGAQFCGSCGQSLTAETRTAG